MESSFYLGFLTLSYRVCLNLTSLVGRILTSFIYKCSNLPLLNHCSQSPSYSFSADSHTYWWQNVVSCAGCPVGMTISFNWCAISTRLLMWFREVTWALPARPQRRTGQSQPTTFGFLSMNNCTDIQSLIMWMTILLRHYWPLDFIISSRLSFFLINLFTLIAG